jgi:hypothetical protein
MSQPVPVSHVLLGLKRAGHDQQPVPTITVRLTSSRQLHPVSFTTRDGRAVAGRWPSRLFLLPGGLDIALRTLVEFVLEAAVRHAARRVPGDKVPPAVDHDPVARVVQAGLDLPRTMPAPPRALSHPVIPCVTSIPMGPRKDPPFGPTSQAGDDCGGGPSEHDRPGRHAFAPIHRANAVVQHARPLQHGRRCSPLSSTPRCFGRACSETSCRRSQSNPRTVDTR